MWGYKPVKCIYCIQTLNIDFNRYLNLFNRYSNMRGKKVEKSEKISLIKSLLTDKLTQDRKKKISDIESIRDELRKQWNDSEYKLEDLIVKEQIWNGIQEKCNRKPNRIVHMELW